MNVHEIAKRAAERLPSFVREVERDIAASIAATVEEAATQERKAKFSLNYSIVIHLDAGKVEHKLSFGSRRTIGDEAELGDSNRLDLLE